MRHPVTSVRGPVQALSVILLFLPACQGQTDATARRAIDRAGAVDAANMAEVMLTLADPTEAVAYFSRALQDHPDNLDLQRGLAQSYLRANEPEKAVKVWQHVLAVAAEPAAEDRLHLTEVLIRSNDWTAAAAELNRIPPTYETFDRYRLEAMVADSRKDWRKADSFYDIASGLTPHPAGVLNNWGFSKLNRGEFAAAERLFTQALTYDPTLFTAKNNLVLARGAQRKYDLPVIVMDQTERANLLYTLGLTAIKQGDISVGKALLAEAIETHPQYFEAAVRSLAALEG